MEYPAINGFGHIDLTVTDVERSARWWEEAMGFKLVANTTSDRDSRCGTCSTRASSLSGWSPTRPPPAIGSMSVWSVSTTLRCECLTGLRWKRGRSIFEDLGVAHSGVQEENGGPVIVLRDPDNIQLELWAFDPDLVKLSPVVRSPTT